jgi:hypothetical protein
VGGFGDGLVQRAVPALEGLDDTEFQRYWDADAKVMTEAVKRIGKDRETRAGARTALLWRRQQP